MLSDCANAFSLAAGGGRDNVWSASEAFDEMRDEHFPLLQRVATRLREELPGVPIVTRAFGWRFGAETGLDSVIDIWGGIISRRGNRTPSGSGAALSTRPSSTPSRPPIWRLPASALLCILRVLLIAMSLNSPGAAQQTEQAGAEPPIARPAYSPGTGPIVAIDEAHENTHTFGGMLQRFVRLLQRDGFRVRAMKDTISSATLAEIDILVMVQPGGWQGAAASLNDVEVTALIEWVRRGGSLLLVLDHMPGPAGGRKIAAALGIDTWHDGYAAVETVDGPVYVIRYQRAGPQEAGVFQTFGGGSAWQGPDARVVENAVTTGGSPDEQVHTVLTFGGSAFRPVAGAEPVLVLPERAISLAPAAPGGNPSSPGTPHIPVGGWLGGAVMQVGQGRVALFGDAGMFSAQWPVHPAAADNYKLVLNVMRWLGRTQTAPATERVDGLR